MMSEEEIGQEEEVSTEETEEEAELDVEEEPTETETDDPEPDESDDEPAEMETWGSEAEYLKSRGIEDAEDIDSVVESYKALKQRIAEDERRQMTEPTRPPVEQEKPQSGDGYFPRGVHARRVQSAIESGQITAESAGQYKALAALQDSALDPVFDKVESSMNALVGHVLSMTKAVRDDSWAKTPKLIRDKFKRSELDAIMDKHQLFDYRKAAEYAAISGGGGIDFFAELAKGQATPQETIKKKLPKFSGAKRTKPVSSGAGKWDKYLDKNGDPNKAKVDKLSPESRSEFWAHIIKREKNKG